MSGPLAGIVVVDFTERVQGPYATQMLGDFGADVIKIERPTAVTPDGRPDERYAAGTGPPPDSLYRATFLANNRSKRSIAVDLKSEDGLRTMRALIGTADVVYENFRPGVMDRLGLGYDACRDINPGVVYVSASGYGPDGPRVSKPGQDVMIQAMSGIGVINESADGRPTPIGMSITDVLGGLNGVAAVLAALVHRERTGEGQQVWVDLLGQCVRRAGRAPGAHAQQRRRRTVAGDADARPRLYPAAIRLLRDQRRIPRAVERAPGPADLRNHRAARPFGRPPIRHVWQAQAATRASSRR